MGRVPEVRLFPPLSSPCKEASPQGCAKGTICGLGHSQAAHVSKRERLAWLSGTMVQIFIIHNLCLG